jgi:hypothetical protein
MAKKVKDDVPGALDRLSSLRENVKTAMEERDKAIDKLLEPLYKKKVTAIRNQCDDTIASLEKEIAPLEARIRLAVIEEESTIRGSKIGEDNKVLCGQYNRPRKSCDMDKLLGFALAHPEVKECIIEAKDGTCTITRLKPE